MCDAAKKTGTLYNLNWLHLKWKLYLQFLFWKITTENKERLIVLLHIFNSGEIPLTCFKSLLSTPKNILGIQFTWYQLPYPIFPDAYAFLFNIFNWICRYMLRFLSKAHICISSPSKPQFNWETECMYGLSPKWKQNMPADL